MRASRNLKWGHFRGVPKSEGRRTGTIEPRADRPARRHRGHDEEGAGRAEAADAEAAGVVQRAELDGGTQ